MSKDDKELEKVERNWEERRVRALEAIATSTDRLLSYQAHQVSLIVDV